MDKREAILGRLVAIAERLPGIKTAVRNQDEVSERARPAVVIFDGDETVDENGNERRRNGEAPSIIEMTPEALIHLGAVPETIGPALNAVRAKLINAVLTDSQLLALTGPNGRVRYIGCSTHLGHGRSMEGSMSVQFAFAYVLRPDQL